MTEHSRRRCNGQYGFVDGHFIDTLNEGIDDTGPADDDDSWPEAILRDLMGFCGCVDIHLLVPLVRTYLTGGWGSYDEVIIHFTHTDPLQSVVAWLCCEAGLTEHGGNVGGSWLRPEGVRWLELAST